MRLLLISLTLSLMFIGWIASWGVTGCDVLRISGTNESSLSGIYVKQYDVNTDGGNNRLFYVQENGRHTICAVSKVRWIVTSGRTCNTSGARIYIDDPNPEPHHVTGPWKECIPDERSGRCWREAPTVVVSCHECHQLRLVNVTISNNARYLGDYVKANFTCNGKYVYHNGPMYIIYWAGQWRIHDDGEPCNSNTGDLKARELVKGLRSLNIRKSSWKEWNGSHYVSSTVTLTCLRYSDSDNIEKEESNPTQIPECHKLRLLNVTISNNAKYLGNYVKTNFTCHEKNVYQNSKLYIIYWAGQWRVHGYSEPCDTKSGDIRVRPANRKLPYITSDDDTWMEWDGTNYINSNTRLICLDFISSSDFDNNTKLIMKNSTSNTERSDIWIYYVPAIAGVIIIVIISVIIVIRIRIQKKHTYEDVRPTALVSYNNNALYKDDDPDELLIIDNIIYSHYTNNTLT